MPAMDIPDFASLLRRYRRRSGLTQEELAERAGLSAASVSLLERGITRAPQRATVNLLSTALALTSDETLVFFEMARESRHLPEEVGGDALEAVTTSEPQPQRELPMPLTPLIGRERELARLLALLARDTTRLLTLTGPAGVGKTRLALELAATLRREQCQDVVFVGLIPIREPERVLPAIAQATGVSESDSLPLRESLMRALRDRALVLLLDNFEQVLPAARGVLELLVACPRVKALVTSRTSLNLRGEQCFPVTPLPLADAAQMASVEALRHVPTVALFLDRARAVWPDFEIATLVDGVLVAGICARLDGLPLAIELAAARTRHFGLRQLHDRLADHAFLGVLSEGAQDLAGHQRTMRSTIAWSYDLLSDEEKRLFRWLGVFVGGATIDAAEAVVGIADEAFVRDLATLVNASLVQCLDVGEMPRYTHLVTLRAYAEERLRGCGEWDEARGRHAGYFLELAELAHLAPVGQIEDVMPRLKMEYDNLRAALAWAWETDATLHGLRMASALWNFWYAQSHLLEGLDWLERFITRAGKPNSHEERSALALAWTGVAALSHRLDRFEHARDAAEAALTLRRELGDTTQIASALMNLANPLVQLGDHDQARALYEESLALQRRAGNRQGLVFPLMNLGELSYQMGKPREALAYYEESLAISHEVGEKDWARGLTWNNVGEAYLVLDEPDRAIEVVEPTYQLFVRQHDLFCAATCAFTLGRAHWRLGNVRAARACLDEAERLFGELGNLGIRARVFYFRASLALEAQDTEAARQDLLQALQDLSGQTHANEYIWSLAERAGTFARARGEPEEAARLYAAGVSHRDALPSPMEPVERELRARDLAWLHEALRDTAFERIMAEGEALSLDETHAALTRLLKRTVPATSKALHELPFLRQSAQPPRQHQQQDAEDNRIDADEPDQSERPGGGKDDEQQAEDHRGSAAEDQQPLVADDMAQLDGLEDFHDAGDDRPGGDEEQQHQASGERPAERQDADEDSGDALDEQPAPVTIALAPTDCQIDGEDAIHEGKGPEECDQDDDGNTRPYQRENAKDQCRQAAQPYHPPVSR